MKVLFLFLFVSVVLSHPLHEKCPDDNLDCYTEVNLKGEWKSSGEITYSFCPERNKPRKVLQDITHLRILHYHQNHKAFDQIYPLCDRPPCIDANTGCIINLISRLALTYEPPNQEEGTYMLLHLLVNKNIKKEIRLTSKQELEERTRFILTD